MFIIRQIIQGKVGTETFPPAIGIIVSLLFFYKDGFLITQEDCSAIKQRIQIEWKLLKEMKFLYVVSGILFIYTVLHIIKRS